jgi:phosphatidylinositol phospholipase C gamma-1
LKLAPKDIKDHFDSVDKYKEGKIGYDQYVELYHDMCEDHELTHVFDQYSSDPAKQTISAADLVKFYKDANSETMKETVAKDIIARYSRNGKFKVSDFVEFLLGNENTILHPQRTVQVYQDMTRPLTEYFMASSHNSYLMGDQLRSKSSPEAYVRELRTCARCVELDTWDGGDDGPIIYHGHTMTSKIKFYEVIQAIVEHGFVTSKYPIVLSMENHCSVPQQKLMVQIMHAETRDLLCTGPENFAASEQAGKYPSPEHLAYKIIFKHKKLSPGQTEVVLQARQDEDMSDSIKNGFLQMREVDGLWTRAFFCLTADKLIYGDSSDFDDKKKEEDEKDRIQAGMDAPPPPVTSKRAKHEELHFSEPWFHGQLLDGTEKPNGRAIAEGRMRDHIYENSGTGNKFDGLFMVRESTTFIGEFSLSFYRPREQKIEHCRIQNNGTFFITPVIAFANIFELVAYYSKQPLASSAFSVILKDHVPQPPAHLAEKWFHSKASRVDAEKMLKRIPADGAFLVRPSSTDSGLSLSFRADGKIKHCQIHREGRLYVLGDAEFDGMIDMISYYEANPLYRKMKLRFPVCPELLASKGVDPDPDAADAYEAESMYFVPDTKKAKKKKGEEKTEPEDPVMARAVFAFVGKDKDEMGFPVGAIISGIDKDEGGWWEGNYNSKRGWFPANYVKVLDAEVMEDEMGPDKTDVPMGEFQKAFIVCNNIRAEAMASHKDQRLVFKIINDDPKEEGVSVGLESADQMKEWAIAMQEANRQWVNKSKTTAAAFKTFKIEPRLSDFVWYFTSVKFKDWDKSAETGYQLMSSFGEKQAMHLASSKAGQAAKFVQYNIRNFARVYPKGSRVNSSNYDPQVLWNCGAQVVALNYQTPDRPMWVNMGKFKVNAKSGYLLRPECQFDTKNMFDPYSPLSWAKQMNPLEVKIKIISARHLVKPGKGYASPYIHIGCSGVELDTIPNVRRTKGVSTNGFRPNWNETVTLEISMPELAVITFTVYDEDQFGDSNAIGQASLPIGTQDQPLLRSGYRSVQLQNIHSDDLELASILCEVKLSYGATKRSKETMKIREQLAVKHDARGEIMKNIAAAKEDEAPEKVQNALQKQLKAVSQDILKLEKKQMDLDASA